MMAPIVRKRGRFGMLTVIRLHGQDPYTGRARWLCRCDCGKTKIVAGHHLSADPTKGSRSCGCQIVRGLVARSTTHGQTGTRTYRAWRAMLNRCNNPSHQQFHRYGGAGIRVCKRWLNFQKFMADMGARPTPAHTLDRFPDRHGNYRPGNVRWATPAEQSRNRDDVKPVAAFGRVLTLREWTLVYPIKYATLWRRIRAGVSPEIALTAPLVPRGKRHLGMPS